MITSDPAVLEAVAKRIEAGLRGMALAERQLTEILDRLEALGDDPSPPSAEDQARHEEATKRLARQWDELDAEIAREMAEIHRSPLDIHKPRHPSAGTVYALNPSEVVNPDNYAHRAVPWMALANGSPFCCSAWEWGPTEVRWPEGTRPGLWRVAQSSVFPRNIGRGTGSKLVFMAPDEIDNQPPTPPKPATPWRWLVAPAELTQEPTDGCSSPQV